MSLLKSSSNIFSNEVGVAIYFILSISLTVILFMVTLFVDIYVVTCRGLQTIQQ